MKTFILLMLPALLLSVSPSSGQTLEPQAPDLAKRLGCFACHSVNGKGGKIAVPLDGVGARLSPENLKLVLRYPRRLHPGAKMPSYAYLPQHEQEALVQYLESLKWGSDWKSLFKFFFVTLSEAKGLNY